MAANDDYMNLFAELAMHPLAVDTLDDGPTDVRTFACCTQLLGVLTG